MKPLNKRGMCARPFCKGKTYGLHYIGDNPAIPLCEKHFKEARDK